MGGLALAAVALAAALAAPASAQRPLPEDNAGADQYIEPVPDAGGDRQPERGGDRPGRLPAGTRDALPPGEEGRALEAIATDPAAGAPSGGSVGSGGGSGEVGRGGSDRGGDSARDGTSEAGVGTANEDTGAISALMSAVTDSDSSALPILLVALGGLTLAGLAVRRGRRS